MEPLSALAIAASIVQFVDFGNRLLSRTWDVYKRPDAAAQELTTIAEELSMFSSRVRESFKGLRHDEKQSQPSETESQLSRLCDECDVITSDFQTVLRQIRRRHSGRSAQDKVTRFVLAIMWSDTKIAVMKERLDILRRRVMTAVLFCLWHDSKRTEQWELHFSKQLEHVTSIISRVDEAVGRLSKEPPSLAALQEIAPTSRITGDVITALHGESSEASQIRDELVQHIWRRGWQRHDPMTAPTFSHTHMVDLRLIARTICDGLTFDAIRGREEAVIEPFKKTFEWIFNRNPKQQDETPAWSSFPEWLEGSSTAPYWIAGKPGSGKSTIMKFITGHPSLSRHLSCWAESSDLIAVRYYAWNAGLSMQKSWEGLMRTILFQSLEQRPDLIPLVSPRRWALFQVLKATNRFPPWELWEVQESFQALLTQCWASIKIFLLIDGLDEFDLAPGEVVRRIRDLTETSASSLKVCLASRPWTEFDDAYGENPMLRMDSLTQDDMAVFVEGKFRDNKGYTELMQLYPTQMTQLTIDIVSKAKGVYLWVSIVVNELLEAMTEGRTIADLQATLKSLPSDISDLYDTIWSRIPSHHRADASMMIQVVKVACGTLSWFTLWLAEECQSSKVDVHTLSPEIRYYARKALRRRLATRTRGILELTYCSWTWNDGYAGFSHRTARDWAKQPSVWQLLCSAYKGDPYLTLLHAEMVLMSDKETNLINHSNTSFWHAVTRTLFYASQVRSPAHEGELVTILDAFDEAATQSYRLAQDNWPIYLRLRKPTDHWSSKQDSGGHRLALHNTFLGMAAQFSLLPYIRAKFAPNRSLLTQRATAKSIGLLECAVLGFNYYMAKDLSHQNVSGVPLTIWYSQRLDTVRYLLNQGVKGDQANGHLCVVNLKSQVRQLVLDSAGSEAEYYVQASELLQMGGGLKGVSKSLLNHIRFGKSKGRS
ncbi:hypothetical protein B0T17DRAFT_498541 [Bombardia bombarda]|uniref:Nephrocystin 3-like N-terminal domain-containing protein n=1 Tax=Bombardia bombarda TaxID=252184 RepID=A0AA39WGT2_9PEZI|nr:hypothetical protein B0T17DRAFT_498541 [Bombardia bombarda]